MQDQFRNSLLRSRPGKRALSAFRAVRALPERYRRELTSLEAPEATWRGNRVHLPRWARQLLFCICPERR